MLFHRPDGWALPSVDIPVGPLPDSALALTREVRRRLGADVTLLRRIDDPETIVLVLENHDAGWQPPPDARWTGRDDVDGDLPIVPELRAAVMGWLDEAESGRVPPLRAPWERTGWLAEAAGWIDRQMARLGITPAGPPEQRKAAWGWSCILRAPAAGGDLYFKAGYARPPSEPAVILALAERWPASVPDIVAADLDRRWMLMRDFGPRTLPGQPVAHWAEAARRFAGVQVACAADLGRWRALDLPDRRPETLPAVIATLLGDTAAMLPGRPGGLTAAELAALRALAPRLIEKLSRLAGYAVPASIVQQDFRPENVVLTDAGPVCFDWSDTVIGHPFFALTRFLNFVPRDEPALREALRDAYLEPWAAFEPRARLLETFELARQLNALYVGVRWYLELPWLEPESSWSRTLAAVVPDQMRDVLGMMASVS